MPANAAEAAAIIGSHVATNARAGAAEWEQLPELPGSWELLNPYASTEQLPWFPKDRKWASKAEYLEAVYKVLRFEGIEGLRYSVKTLKAQPRMTDDDNTCVYTNVRVQGYLFAMMGPAARISFSTQRANARIRWSQSKRLQAGKIVALSNDYFVKDCRVAVVAQRPVEGGLDLKPPVINIFWANPAEAVVDPDQEFIMVESRNGYYEAVRHALKGLQHAAREWSPIDKYTVSLNTSDLACSSITSLNLSSLVDHLTAEQLAEAQNKTAQQEMFQDTEDWFRECKVGKMNEIKPHTTLDDSQLEALQRIITKELAIVQGPPGTGKTFTSVKSLKAMLQNRQPGDPPIIVSAQTNHALDQILIYCRSAGASIMRVGGRTENDEIAERTIFELRKSAGKLPGGQYGILEKERAKIVDRFAALVHGVFGGAELLDSKALLEAGVINNEQHESLSNDSWETIDGMSEMDVWLGDEKIESIRQQLEDDFDFDHVEAADESIEFDANFNDDQKLVDEDDRLRGTYIPLMSEYTGLKPVFANWAHKCRQFLEKRTDLYDIPSGCRGGVYLILQSRLRDANASRFRETLQDAVKQAQKQKIAKWTKDLAVIDKHCIDIIGCTTTGLTKYRGFLAAMQPRVLLIEEAAETREANITSALFPSLQQLVLVGDHQQLPPSCDIARLSQHPYNLNVSLFERLVHNSLPYTMLDRQRRMAPELRYIVQKFYPKLQDHDIVKDISKRPLVPGLGDRRSWFFTHQWPEDTDADNSKCNPQEAEMVVAFVRYLLHNNVKASEITILTYYKGQKWKLLQRLRRSDIPIGNYFNVATVDSYQGEENEIVILSLVRSPQPGRNYNVGFLDSMNRATVAISRARRGFFMFGNKANLLNASVASFNTWARVWNGFAEQHRVAMGKGLPLVCQNHNKEIWVKDADGLVGNAGGCDIKCKGKLACGHDCALMCHNVPHEKLPCLRPCTKILPCGHKCAGYCSDPCQCAVNCSKFRQVQVNMQMVQLQVADTRATSPGAASRSLTSSGSQNQVAWHEMARNPKAHDAAMRESRLKGNLEFLENCDDSTPATVNQALENIQERFITVSNLDGRRVVGEVQNMDAKKGLQGKEQIRNNGHKHKFGAQDARLGLYDAPSCSSSGPRQQQAFQNSRGGQTSKQPGQEAWNTTVRDRVQVQGVSASSVENTRAGVNMLSAVRAKLGRPEDRFGQSFQPARMAAPAEGAALLDLGDNITDNATIYDTEIGFNAEVARARGDGQRQRPPHKARHAELHERVKNWADAAEDTLIDFGTEDGGITDTAFTTATTSAHDDNNKGAPEILEPEILQPSRGSHTSTSEQAEGASKKEEVLIDL